MREILQIWKEQQGFGTLVSNNDQDIMKCIEIAIEMMPTQKIGIVVPNMKYFTYKRKFGDRVIDNSLLYSHRLSSTTYMIAFVVDVDTYKYSTNLAIQRIESKYKFYTAFDYSQVPDYVEKTAKRLDTATNSYNEYNLVIPMGVAIAEMYSKIEARMSDILGVFRDYDNITGCIQGDKDQHIDPLTFRNNFAADNGWNKDLNVAIPMFANIDKFYNPDNLFEQATLYNNLVRERSNIIDKSNDKVKFALSVVKANDYRQIVILAKGDDMCDNVAETLNRNGVKAISIHANTPNGSIKDHNGEHITYKSGTKKGRIKDFGTLSMNKHYLELFKNRKIRVIVTTGTLDKKAEIVGCELMVVLSARAANYYRVKSRLAKFDFIKDVNIINISFDVSKDLEAFKQSQSALNSTVITTTMLPELVF